MTLSERALRWGLAGILGAYLLLSLAYSIVNPILESPDEVLNYENVRFLIEKRRLPVLQEDELSKGHHPPLYYVLGALLTSWLTNEHLDTLIERANPFWAYRLWEPGVDNKSLYLHDPSLEGWPYRDVSLGVHMIRWMSVLMGAGVLLAVHSIAQELLPHERPLALGAVAVVAFNPMFLYVQSSVHNDALTNLWAALTLWGVVRYWLRGPSAGRATFLGVLSGLGILTKITFLFLLPAVAVALGMRNGLERRDNTHWHLDLARDGLICAGCIALVGGWWFVRNQLVYGEPTSMGRQVEVWGIRENAPDVGAAVRELGFLHNSFWGVFGYGQIPMPGWVYDVIQVSILFAAGGLAVWGVRSWRARGRHRLPALLLAALMVAPVAAFGATFARMMISATADFGRYLFTAYGAIAPALILGWTEWLPASRRTAAAGGLTFALLLLGIGALVGVIAPAYTPPPRYASVDEVDVEHRIDAKYPGLARLLGYSITPPSVLPGETLEVTLYWQVVGTASQNYVVFVQLMAGDGTRVGNRDTHPGLGRYPTRRWQPGEIIADTIPIPVQAEARGPTGLRLDLGLHDDEGKRLTTVDGRDTISTGTIRLAAREAASPVGDSVHYMLADRVELIAVAPPLARTEPGDELSFTLTWRCAQPPDIDYVVFVHLIDSAGQKVAQSDGPPQNGAYPTHLWQPGDVVIDARQLPLPQELPSGSYRAIGGWYRLDTMARLPVYSSAGDPLPNAAIPLFTVDVQP